MLWIRQRDRLMRSAREQYAAVLLLALLLAALVGCEANECMWPTPSPPSFLGVSRVTMLDSELAPATDPHQPPSHLEGIVRFKTSYPAAESSRPSLAAPSRLIFSARLPTS
jgi:hypothetical protein